VMTDNVGPFRTQARLDAALAEIDRLTRAIGAEPMASGAPFDTVLIDWLDLRNMLLVARSVCLAAQARCESRGAHQREDLPGLDPRWQINQIVQLRAGEIDLSGGPVRRVSSALAEIPA
jgi:succinate dehydrogenase / fumarate reductase flavoprotein subunit